MVQTMSSSIVGATFIRLGLLVLLVVAVQSSASAGWPPSVPTGGMSMYQCCCPENPDCGGCFRCRNNAFTCYCGSCSCYADRDGEIPTSRQQSEVDLIKLLLRGGGRSRN